MHRRYHFFLACIIVSFGGGVTAEPLREAICFTEVARKQVNAGDHTITLIRVRPPVLPKALPPQESRLPSAEDLATAERYAGKGHATLSVSATVYLGGPTPITEIRWRNETGDTEHHAWSNVDFRYLAQIPTLETETTVYIWFPFIESFDLKDRPTDQNSSTLAGLSFSPTEAEYFLDSRTKESKEHETTLAGLDHLHAYYKIHYPTLKADYEKRMAENAERERQQRENPPKTSDVTIHFWPIKSTANPQ
jgi:hypothetical protein